MLYKFSFSRTRQVPRGHGQGDSIYRYMEEQRASSATAVFHSLEKAKAYAQLHSAVPLTWEDKTVYGFHDATVGDTSFMISMCNYETMEPTDPMPIPEEFHNTERDHD